MAFHLCLNLNFLCTGFLGYGEEIRKCSQSPREGKQEGLNGSHHSVYNYEWAKNEGYFILEVTRSEVLILSSVLHVPQRSVCLCPQDTAVGMWWDTHGELWSECIGEP